MTGMMRRLLATTVVAIGLVAAAQPALAACTDPAEPGVNWRRCYHDGRDFGVVDLTGAMLRDATFQRSVLDGSTFDGADAFRAKFISASLEGTSFINARLFQADLTRAILAEADLSGADLRGARLVRADLSGADLTGARLEGADLRDANLSLATWVRGGRICAEGSIGQCN